MSRVVKIMDQAMSRIVKAKSNTQKMKVSNEKSYCDIAVIASLMAHNCKNGEIAKFYFKLQLNLHNKNDYS